MILQNHKDTFPSCYTLAAVVLAIPVSSVPCEWSSSALACAASELNPGYSAQNQIKSKLRNRLSNEALTPLLRMSIEGPNFTEFDYNQSANIFKRKAPKKFEVLAKSKQKISSDKLEI